MCTYAYVRFVTGFFSFFAPLGPLGLMIVWHFPKKCGNAAMPRSFKNTVFAAGEVGFDSPARLSLTVAPSLPCSLCILLL